MRNKNMRKRISGKIITLCLMFVMVVTLASCGSNNQSVPQQTQPETEHATIETQPTVTVPETVPEAAPTTDDIGYDKVKEIVLDCVPGATEADIYELEREFDDGFLQYEGSVYYGGYEYEFEINGTTGDLLQWEIDD